MGGAGEGGRHEPREILSPRQLPLPIPSTSRWAVTVCLLSLSDKSTLPVLSTAPASPLGTNTSLTLSLRLGQGVYWPRPPASQVGEWPRPGQSELSIPSQVNSTQLGWRANPVRKKKLAKRLSQKLNYQFTGVPTKRFQGCVAWMKTPKQRLSDKQPSSQKDQCQRTPPTGGASRSSLHVGARAFTQPSTSPAAEEAVLYSPWSPMQCLETL